MLYFFVFKKDFLNTRMYIIVEIEEYKCFTLM